MGNIEYNDAPIALHKPSVMRETMSCSCGGRQTKVAYSPYYKGLMFACTKHPNGCRSQDEGDYETSDDAQANIDAIVQRYSIRRVRHGALDPKVAP